MELLAGIAEQGALPILKSVGFMERLRPKSREFAWNTSGLETRIKMPTSGATIGQHGMTDWGIIYLNQ